MKFEKGDTIRNLVKDYFQLRKGFIIDVTQRYCLVDSVPYRPPGNNRCYINYSVSQFVHTRLLLTEKVLEDEI